MPLFTHVPGSRRSHAGWMIAWYVVWLRRYGNAPDRAPSGGRRRRTCPPPTRPTASKKGLRPAFDPLRRRTASSTRRRPPTSSPGRCGSARPGEAGTSRRWRSRSASSSTRAQGSTARLGVRERQVLAGDARERERAALVQQVRLERGAEAGMPTRIVPPGLHRLAWRAEREIGLADVAQQRADRAGRRGRTSSRAEGTPARSSSPPTSSSMRLFSSAPASCWRYSSTILRVSRSIPSLLCGGRHDEVHS